MPTAVTNSRGACTTSYHSGRALITTILTMSVSLVTTLAASDGGIISWIPSLDRRPQREDERGRRLRKRRKYSRFGHLRHIVSGNGGTRMTGRRTYKYGSRIEDDCASAL